MTAFDLDPKIRWLFCMTHPDDEIAICAWIKRLTDAGAEVFLNWTHSCPVRESEGRIVATILGISDSNLRFMSATDGKVCDELAELKPKFQALIDCVQPNRVCCAAFEQGHLDHDSTNWLVNQTFKGPIFEVPLYHPYTRRLQRMNAFSTSIGQESLALRPEEWQLKLQVAKSYKSQNIWSVLWWYEAWQTVRFKPVELRKRELMRFQTHKDFAQPNLPEPLRSEVVASAQWHRWLAAVERANMPP
ncbi:MAG: PIG-L family deacetylase [Chlorobia bacterium]|nr:PIG-L family deacetylase [Fimbriimonadaceae bacterium]